MAANPDIYANPVTVSHKWSKKSEGDVPTWFVDLYEKISAGQPIAFDANWSATCPQYEDFPRLPTRPQIVLDDEDLAHTLSDSADDAEITVSIFVYMHPMSLITGLS